MNFKITFAALAAIFAAVSTLPASAGVNTNIKVPFSQNVFVPCANGGAGEILSISGKLHVLITETTDGSGGFHAVVHLNTQGASGVGAVTGDTYRAVGLNFQSFNVAADGLPLIFTEVVNFNMIGIGHAVNLNVHETFHIVLSSNGDVTAEVENLNVTCR